jgi:hypothetical protein
MTLGDDRIMSGAQLWLTHCSFMARLRQGLSRSSDLNSYIGLVVQGHTTVKPLPRESHNESHKRWCLPPRKGPAIVQAETANSSRE